MELLHRVDLRKPSRCFGVARAGPGAVFWASSIWFASSMSAIGGGLSGSTQHSILRGKDGVFGNASRLFSRLYGIRENGALGSLAAGRVAESDWASVW